MNDETKITETLFRLAHINQISLSEKIILAGEASESPHIELKDLLRKGLFSFSKRSIVLKELEKQDLSSLYKRYERLGIHWISMIDPSYPELLRKIYDPPIILFYRGNLSLLGHDKISIVGSRKATSYGRAVIKKIIPHFSPDYLVVSGLARGIDTEAHKETIRANGKTIAVIASGLNDSYPPENRDIQQEIGTHHLLLSEYPIDTPPKKHQFPMRNRIIAGLSEAVIVIEAEYKSGSLITAQLALTEGREVFCVPGNITSPLSLGTNHLIQQGAHCLYDVSLFKYVMQHY